ncbi:sulfotransferase domain-containing protein [Sansalvadorimonas sp. 2012CJ34-2]|uniref:Sulfotransferase domain-containing protein n=1 Tax=Parendozoicomonas callyspongiae TaxID=2942213 RepID=A0ABT0PIP6_9GAMM|nr:sulfotransferase domain-containing protein [Sansalvadorimonas sp. 2012CJ34-2]MCL6270622.1 sulfotransferase domain-containing protein [Sansalvadorimonas sp. 2012CJ34-2]
MLQLSTSSSVIDTDWPSVLTEGSKITLEASTEKQKSKVGFIDKVTPLVGMKEPTRNTMMSKKSFDYGTAMPIEPDDVMLVSPPKTGTTLMQQICNQIKTRGGPDSMNFEDLYQVSPWLGWARDLDTNPNLLASPRIFKTHQSLSSQRRGCRYIATIRDPEKTFISFFNFLKAKGVPTVEQFTDASEFVLQSDYIDDMHFGASLWLYYQEFLKAKELGDLLVIPYEYLVKNKQTVIPTIASFIGVDTLKKNELDTIIHHCSKEFMELEEHLSKFDESWVQKKLQEKELTESEHVRPAPRVVSTQSPELTEPAKQKLRDKWKAGVPDCQDYPAFKAIFEKKLHERSAAKIVE